MCLSAYVCVVMKDYLTPEVAEYGSVEAVTLANEKCEPGSDTQADQIVGSIQECEPA